MSQKPDLGDNTQHVVIVLANHKKVFRKILAGPKAEYVKAWNSLQDITTMIVNCWELKRSLI